MDILVFHQHISHGLHPHHIKGHLQDQDQGFVITVVVEAGEKPGQGDVHHIPVVILVHLAQDALFVQGINCVTNTDDRFTFIII